jgi:hypothetical protein
MLDSGEKEYGFSAIVKLAPANKETAGTNWRQLNFLLASNYEYLFFS